MPPVSLQTSSTRTPLAQRWAAIQGNAPLQTQRPARSKDDLSGFSTNRYDDLIRSASRKYGVPARLIKSVMQQESRFIPTAGSPKGARGLMQLMPGTAKEVGVRNRDDPRQSIDGGTRYLARMLRMFGGDVKKALAGYNAGPGRVLQYGGVPPYKETRTYVRNITRSYYG